MFCDYTFIAEMFLAVIQSKNLRRVLTFSTELKLYNAIALLVSVLGYFLESSVCTKTLRMLSTLIIGCICNWMLGLKIRAVISYK